MPISIRVGNALACLRAMPANSVHCCVTSPPYWGLRDYGTPPQVWGGDPACMHKWSETVVHGRKATGNNYASSGLNGAAAAGYHALSGRTVHAIFVVSFGLPPDEVGVHSGVTTAVDQGGAGAYTIPAFEHYIADCAPSDIRCFPSRWPGGADHPYARGCRCRPACRRGQCSSQPGPRLRRDPRGIRGLFTLGL